MPTGRLWALGFDIALVYGSISVGGKPSLGLKQQGNVNLQPPFSSSRLDLDVERPLVGQSAETINTLT